MEYGCETFSLTSYKQGKSIDREVEVANQLKNLYELT